MPSILYDSQTGEVQWVIRFDENFLSREQSVDETTAQVVNRLTREHFQKKVSRAAGFPCAIVKSIDMPTERNRRYAWRLRIIDGIARVIVDPAVPAPAASPGEEARAEFLALDPKALKPEDLPGIVERLQKLL